LDEHLCQPLGALREDISSTTIREYEPTGETPQKMQYQYPTELPRTQPAHALLAGMEGAPTPSKAAPLVFNDPDDLEVDRSATRLRSSSLAPERNPLSMSLREVNPNLTTTSLMFDPSASTISIMSTVNENTVPLFKKSTTRSSRSTRGKAVVTLEGRENVPPSAFSQSASRRKSPRLH
jgi:kinesin family protein 11